jgi:hypothetical protein
MATIANMGIGALGKSDLVFKRKFRWTLAITDIGTGKASIPTGFLKTAARPNLDIEETEINYMNAKMWIPGKAAWQTMEVVYLDVATVSLQAMWQWIVNVYDMMRDSDQDISLASRRMGSSAGDYSGTANLVMYDGCGEPIESWTMKSAWPKSIDFGELDYSSSDVCEVKMTLRYADVVYVNHCPGMQFAGQCTPCNGRFTGV